MPDTSALPAPSRRFLPALLCALAVGVSVLLSHPVGELAYCDDFSYIHSALDLARTGGIHYNGWAEPILGWQLYLGALFIKLFGFSFAAVHSSVLLIGMLTAALLQRTLLRFGLSQAESALATLTVMLSSMCLPLTFSFMTDISGLFALLLCLFCCLRALDAPTPRHALLWMLAGEALNAIGGTARQIAWLGVLVLVPSALFALRRQRQVVALAAAGWLACVGFIMAALHWYKAQPYSLVEKTFPDHERLGPALKYPIAIFLQVVYFALPVLIAFLLPRRPLRVGTFAALIGGFALAMLYPAGGPLFFLEPWYWAWQPHGGLPGRPEVILPALLQRLLVGITFAALLASLVALRERWPAVRARLNPLTHNRVALVLPFLLITCGLVATRNPIFARYTYPVLMIALAAALRLRRVFFATPLPWLSWVLVAASAAFSIAYLHDEWAEARARLTAIQQMRDRGLPRTAFFAGWEYDGWSQIDAAQTMNSPKLHPPTAIYKPGPRYPLPPGCTMWIDDQLSAIHPQIELAYSRGCAPEAPGYTPVHFRSWLGPHEHTLYFLRMPPPLP